MSSVLEPRTRPRTRPTRRTRTFLLRGLLSIGAMLIALLLAEGVLRTWLVLQGEPHDAQEVLLRVRRLVDPSGGFVPPGHEESATSEAANAAHQAQPATRKPLLHPFTGAEWAHDTGSVLASFRAGFEPDEYTIVVVGGSVAAGWATSNDVQVEEIIGAHPRFAGKRLRVLNYAHAAYKQPQQATRLAFLFTLGYRPDAVICIDGFNEVASALANARMGSHPIYPSAPVWGALVRYLDTVDEDALEGAGRLWALRQRVERRARRALALGAHHSSLASALLVNDLRRLRNERAALQEGKPNSNEDGPAPLSPRLARQLHGPDFERGHDAVLRTGARSWFESSSSIHAMCAERGIYYLHVLQPTLHDEGAKPFAPEELELGPIPTTWQPGARDGYPLLRAYAPALEARGVRFHDASRIFEQVREPLYFDHCHLNRRGNELFGASICRAFVEHLPSGD